MPNFSKSLLSYADVRQAFEKAAATGGIELEFETSPAATAWAARANAFRVLLRKRNHEAGREHACEFDHLMVRRPKGSNLVRIEPRGFAFTSARTVTGEPLEFSKITQPQPQPLSPTSPPDPSIDKFFQDLEEGKLK
jgi:hypothetical protein